MGNQTNRLYTNRQQVVIALNIIVVTALIVGALYLITKPLLPFLALGIPDYGFIYAFIQVFLATPFILLMGGASAGIISLISPYKLIVRLAYLVVCSVLMVAGAWLYTSVYNR